MLAGVDQETRISNFQHVRIFVQCLYNTIHRRLRRLCSGQPFLMEYGGTIKQGSHFEVADLESVEARDLIMMLRCASQSCVRTGDKACQRHQDSRGEAHRISLEYVSTPNNW